MTRNQCAYGALDILLRYGFVTSSFLEISGLGSEFLDRLRGQNMVLINRIHSREEQERHVYTFGPDQLRSLLRYHRALASAVQIKGEESHLNSSRVKQVQHSLRVMTEKQLTEAINRGEIAQMLDWCDIAIDAHLEPFGKYKRGQSFFTSIDDMADSYRFAYMEGYGEYSSILQGVLQNRNYSILVYNMHSDTKNALYYSHLDDHKVLDCWDHNETRYKHFISHDPRTKPIERSCVFVDHPSSLLALLEHFEVLAEAGEVVPLIKECYLIPKDNREFSSCIEMLLTGVLAQRSVELRYRRHNIKLPPEIYFRCDGHEPFDFADRNKLFIADLCGFDIGKVLQLRKMERMCGGQPFGVLIEPWARKFVDSIFVSPHPCYYLYGDNKGEEGSGLAG